MSKLTGYERGEIRGRNCRMLQGPMTEAAAVRQMIVAVRTASLTTVRVTNYRKDGSTFRNMVTIAPVFDTNGVYRFSIGVLSDVERAISDGNALQALRAALPDTFDAAAQPPTFDVLSMRHASPEAQVKQYNDGMTAFVTLEWSKDWALALRQLVAQPICLAALMEWASAESPEDTPQLALVSSLRPQHQSIRTCLTKTHVRVLLMIAGRRYAGSRA
jgi:PAS domain S-box-containing protein